MSIRSKINTLIFVKSSIKSLNMFNIEKTNDENINDIKKDINKIFIESSFLFGSIIAMSYFPPAIIPMMEQMLIYNP